MRRLGRGEEVADSSETGRRWAPNKAATSLASVKHLIHVTVPDSTSGCCLSVENFGSALRFLQPVSEYSESLSLISSSQAMDSSIMDIFILHLFK